MTTAAIFIGASRINMAALPQIFGGRTAQKAANLCCKNFQVLLYGVHPFCHFGEPGQRETRGSLIPVFLFALASLISVVALYQLHDVLPQQDVFWIDGAVVVVVYCFSINYPFSTRSRF